MRKIIHLHWLWTSGPSGAKGIWTGLSECGKSVPRPEFTSHLDDATCEDCLAIVRRRTSETQKKD